MRLALLPLFALAACGAAPVPAHPALWLVEGAHGERAWLFGTIHALEAPAQWHSPAIDRALAASDRIVVEVSEVRDDAAMGREFLRLAATSAQPPLSARVVPGLRSKLAHLLKVTGLSDTQFAETKTWAAALMLARNASSNLNVAYGVDKAVLEAMPGKPVAELEGTANQLGTFDTLPEQDQRDLLNAVVRDGGAAQGESEALARAWRRGDMSVIESETRRGVLADPELRAALFTRRNRAWSARISALLRGGARPFVAVGAAHMAGHEGLPALLAAQGLKVRRLQ